jgi:hypothetical protein
MIARTSRFVPLALALGLVPSLAHAQIRTVLVSPVPGNPIASGTALINALAAIPAPSSTNRWLLKVEPGVYDLSLSGPLLMRSWVDIEGAGIGETHIQAPGSFVGPVFPVIFGASDAELRHLTLESVAAVGQGTKVMANFTASPRLYRVRLLIRSGTTNWAMENQDAAPILEEVEISVTGSGTNIGISYSAGTPTYVDLRRCRVSVTDGTSNYGVLTTGNVILREVRDSEIEAARGQRNYGIYLASAISGTASTGMFLSNTEIDGVGGSIENYGIHASGSNFSLKLLNMDVRAVSGTTSHGIFVSPATNVPVTVVNSDLRGNTGVITSSSGVVATNSSLNAGPVTGATEICAGVADENAVFFPGPACP